MTAKTEKPDAVALLKADHRKVEDLLEKFESAKSDSVKKTLAMQICTELSVHATIEEEIFYPACAGAIEEDLLNEAYVEHDGAKVLINDIEASSMADSFFEAKVTVLGEDIKHHVHEEEARGDGLFSACRATGVDMIELKDKLFARKLELLELAKSGPLPPAQLAVVKLAA